MKLRLSLGKLMALMVPVAAYLALFRVAAMVNPFPRKPGSIVVMALFVVLLALLGLAMVAYRRPLFFAGIVQMMTPPLVLLAGIGLNRVFVSGLLIFLFTGLPVFTFTLAFFMARPRRDPDAPRPGMARALGEAVADGLVSLALTLTFGMCCLGPFIRP